MSTGPAGQMIWWAGQIGFARERSMLDLILIAAGLGLFALSIGYAFACDRL